MNQTLINRLLNIISKYLAIIVLPIFIFIALNRTSRFDNFNYHSPVFSDGAGYYSYLVNFFASNVISDLPGNISQLTGDAFNVNKEKNIIETKYTCGTAILISPFFLLGNLIDNISGGEEDVFSRYYTFWVIIAACFYAAISLWLLQKIVLRTINHQLLSIVIPLIFYLSTNIYFYAFDRGGYSHIYSMFCFTAIIYFTPNFYNKPSYFSFILMLFLVGIAIICRPTNALFAMYLLFYQDENSKLKNRVVFYLKNYKYVIFGVIAFIIALSPQLYYWYLISGKFIYYSYTDEGFTYWKNPQILKFLISPNNGWLIYSPIILLSLIGIISGIKNKINNMYLLLILLISTIYLFSSWWCPNYGCAFGMRVMVEYYPMLIIPFSYLIIKIFNKHQLPLKLVVSVFVMACIVANFDILYYYDGCFYGEDWDWKAYFKLFEN